MDEVSKDQAAAFAAELGAKLVHVYSAWNASADGMGVTIRANTWAAFELASPVQPTLLSFDFSQDASCEISGIALLADAGAPVDVFSSEGREAARAHAHAPYDAFAAARHTRTPPSSSSSVLWATRSAQPFVALPHAAGASSLPSSSMGENLLTSIS